MSYQRVIGALLAMVLSTGCYSRYQLAPQELYKLNGFREGQTVELESVDGDRVRFNNKTDLRVEAIDGQSMNAKYAAVNIDGQTMTGVIKGSGAPVNIDLGQVVNAEAKSYNVGKSLGLGLGLGLGIPIVVFTTIFVVLAAGTVSAFDR